MISTSQSRLPAGQGLMDQALMDQTLSDPIEPEEILPGSADLPDSDDTPVDNEGQNDIPNGLRQALAQLWQDRQDWFFGVDMAIYDREGQRQRTPTLIPDGFLALGVTRRKGEWGRRSYVLAEENNIVPILALEYLSHTYGGEYDRKLERYRQLGVLYYVIYNPEGRRKRPKLVVYKLEEGQYQALPSGEPFWLPEIGLGLGRVQGTLSGIKMEWLAWFDSSGNPYPLPEEVVTREQQRAEREWQRAEQAQQQAEQERHRAEQAQQQVERLAAKLRALGIDLDQEV
jgi:Uma2 family endonuclease